ncbi:YczE/YyaS/YitT family protein [Wukongibacter sp. M2B1]|uniref:YczE/YyaS/YitT family protein n=1 Tax=Wukongibacter sp. M2B1 TaxID=3088895 RepID=UPI003D79BD44
MYLKNLLRLILGLLLYALGVVLSINANLGVAPWDTFHQGLSNLVNVTFGQASIIVGFIIVLINLYLKENIGIGTILNMILIGLFIDLIFYYNIIPIMDSFISGLLMIILSMFTISLASYCYIGAKFGSGPRDGLMVGLTKKTGYPVGLIRGLIELSVLFIGFLLGGKVGIGTVILAFGIGPIVQFTFDKLHFEVSDVKHIYLFDKSKAE